MSLRSQLLKKQAEKGVPWNIIELDYALSWVLSAIGECKVVRENLIFKGGTCLKKCYFGEHYRFSEDLDFTAAPTLSDSFLDRCLQEVIQVATELSAREGSGVEYKAELYQERESHPFNQRAYILRAKFPWHRVPLTKIKVEISRDEELVFPVEARNLLHEYGEAISHSLKTYALEEILAEKYRGILQNQERLKIKGWVRSRVRDFYDIWQILKHFKEQINLIGFKDAFSKKCTLKGITFENEGQFFNHEAYLKKVKRDWEQYLKDLLIDLPSFETMLAELQILTTKVFKG